MTAPEPQTSTDERQESKQEELKTTNANGSKHGQAGKTEQDTDELQQFDVDEAIAAVTDFGNRLIIASKQAKHHFRKEWLDQLMQRYKERPGKPIIHLDDLENGVLVALDGQARAKVADYFQGLQIGHRFLWRRFRLITNFSKGRSSRPSRLGTWKEFANLESGLPMRSLEPHVTLMRISDGKYIRTIRNPTLPINLATPAGAKVMGYRGDVHHGNSSFTNENRVLHEDYRRCIKSVVGDITVSETILHHGGFTSKHYIRTNVGKYITRVATIAGLDNDVDQLHANNPSPMWLVRCDDESIGAYLAALWDAEGSVNEHDIKLSQALSLDLLPTTQNIPYWHGRITPKHLEEQNRRYVLERPPLLLVSAAILLFKFGIVSHLQPIGLSRSGSDIASYWQLRFHKISDARIFRDKIKLLSYDKLQTLNTWLDTT